MGGQTPNFWFQTCSKISRRCRNEQKTAVKHKAFPNYRSGRPNKKGTHRHTAE